MAAKIRKTKKNGRELAPARRGGGRREIVVATRAERLDEGRQVALGVKTQAEADKQAGKDQAKDEQPGSGSGDGSETQSAGGGKEESGKGS